MTIPATPTASVETRRSWTIAVAALAILGMSFGSLWISVVALKPIAAEMGNARSVPALASALAWFGAAAGGIIMGPLAYRVGIRWTVIGGAVMICIGLFVSTLGQPWHLYVGHGLFMGLLGNAGLNAPLYVYVSRWFDQRRGSALALISSGVFISGFITPTPFELAVAAYGWRWTMTAYGLLVVAVIVPVALIFLKEPPEAVVIAGGGKEKRTYTVLGWNPNAVFALLAIAAFMCCVAMSMPQGHLVALCSDHGISPSIGAAMLSTLLGAGFISRQGWGWVADRIGGLRTAFLSSSMQAAAMTGFIYTQDEAGLFTVSLAFGIGFSALIPAYVLTVREMFPLEQAHWRVPMLLFMNGSGMAVGGWLAGYLYDQFGFYGAAFATGLAFNLANIAILTALVIRQKLHSGELRQYVTTPLH